MKTMFVRVILTCRIIEKTEKYSDLGKKIMEIESGYLLIDDKKKECE